MSDKKKILLADDEEDVKTIVEVFLQSKGFEVVTAFDGLSALDLVRTERPDLILLDVMMPVVNGFEVCTRLKSDPATRDIPIIMLSAMGQAESVDRGLAAGAADYMVKPFDPVQLLEMIQRHLAA
ncbi:MAG: response regulator [Candidatus Sumerlaeia bacterium]|nr:response regulator [Candidatus Sumerlaeia bacterium]